MRTYDLTDEAVNDLREIVRYTLKQRGETQVRRYQKALTDRLEAVAKGEVVKHTFSNNLPDVYVTRCEHHYIFYTTRNRARPLILAILHERRDIVTRLVERLE